MSWSKQDIYKLIEMFEAREVLWNTISEDYKNRNKKHDAWTEIANEFNMEKKVVEIKIRSLVGQFNRECKSKFGAGANESSKWFAFKKLMFLRGKNISSSTSDGGLQSNEEKSCDSENTITVKETSVKKVFATPEATPKPFRKRKRPEEQEDTTQQEVFLKNMYETRNTNRDECDAFGEYVSIKLKQLKHSYARNTAQHHINTILYNASIGQYDLPTNMRDPTASGSWEYNSYNSTQSPFAISENNAACSSRGYYIAPNPSILSENITLDSFKAHTSARTPSPSDFSESSQDSKQSLHDLLRSTQN